MGFCRWLVIAVLFVGTIFGAADVDAQKRDKPSRQIRKLVKYFKYIDKYYVDEVDVAPYIDDVLRQISSELDPFSKYLSAEEYKQLQKKTTRKVAGIGADYAIVNDTIVVLSVRDDSPAQMAGLKTCDRLIAVDGDNAVGLDALESQALILGEPDTQVELSVVRRDADSLLKLKLTRRFIPEKSVLPYYKLSDSVGYIRIQNFSYYTSNDFEHAMSQMSGVKTLILDLTDNTGGLIRSAAYIAGQFLPKGNLILSREGKNPKFNRKTTSKGELFHGNLIVMINESTASASEIVAGALQDWDRAIIIGRSSFGKGVGQNTYRFDDGSALQLTSLKAHTPSGRVIQRPYEPGNREQFYYEYIDRNMSATTLSHIDTANLPLYRTMRLGRPVYGGGGIHPDIVIPVTDTLRSTLNYKRVVSQISSAYLVYCLDKYYNHIKTNYAQYSTYADKFRFDDEDVAYLMQLVVTQVRDSYWMEYQHLLPEALLPEFYLRLASLIYSDEEYYKAAKANDDIYGKAIEIANDWDSVSGTIFGK